MKFLLCIFLFTVVGNFLFADQITMKDGDRVSGEIVKKDGETVTVKSKNFGTVTLKWSDIADVKTDMPLNVVLPGDQTVQANIATQGTQIQVQAPGAPRNVAPADIVALRNADEQRAYVRYLHPGIFDLWTVNGSIGLAGATGNAKTFTLVTPLNFDRLSKTSHTSAYFNLIRSRATVAGVTAQTANAIRGGWAYSRNLDASKFFFNAFNDYDYDAFQDLDLRVVAGGGIGYVVWSREASRLSVVAGADWNREAFGATLATPALTRNSAEAYWGDDFTSKLNTRTTAYQRFRMFNNLSDTGVYRMNIEAGTTTQFTKWLNWTLALSDRYLSNPVPGRLTNDFLYTTSLGFQWSR